MRFRSDSSVDVLSHRRLVYSRLAAVLVDWREFEFTLGGKKRKKVRNMGAHIYQIGNNSRDGAMTSGPIPSH